MYSTAIKSPSILRSVCIFGSSGSRSLKDVVIQSPGRSSFTFMCVREISRSVSGLARTPDFAVNLRAGHGAGDLDTSPTTIAGATSENDLVLRLEGAGIGPGSETLALEQDDQVAAAGGDGAGLGAGLHRHGVCFSFVAVCGGFR